MKAAMATMALALAVPVGAGARDLAVPATKGWQHAATGLSLRSQLLGLPRTRLSDSRDDERDVSAQFNDPALDVSATVYVFHPALMSVPIWFDRADYAATHRADNGGATPVGPASAFAPPRTGVAAGLRRRYVPNRGSYRSEALAVLPLDEWLVAIRLSSRLDDPVALDRRLDEAIAEIGWPADATAPTSAAVPVAPCASSLETKHAALRPPDMSMMLFGAMLAGMKPGDAKTTPTPAAAEPWCRDRAPAERYGMYRKPSARDAYVLAIGDSGRTIDVAPAPVLRDLPGGAKGGGYTPTLRDLGGEASLYASFDKLPDPEQVFEMVRRTPPVSRVTQDAGGKRNVSINAGQIRK